MVTALTTYSQKSVRQYPALQVRIIEHTWEGCDLALQDVQQILDSVSLSVYTAACTLVGVARTQRSSFLFRLVVI